VLLSDNNEVKYGGLGVYRLKELDRLSVSQINQYNNIKGSVVMTWGIYEED